MGKSIMEIVLNKLSSFLLQIHYTHKEKAWTENEKDKSMISYKDYAFELSGI